MKSCCNSGADDLNTVTEGNRDPERGEGHVGVKICVDLDGESESDTIHSGSHQVVRSDLREV